MKRILVLLLLATGAHGATFTVTTTGDSGPGSLRQAITDANANAAVTDTIEFNIAAAGVQTITPLTALPAITDPVIIDGYTQPGASANTLAVGTDAALLIELSGATAGGTGLVFQASAGGSAIRGLVINRFQTGITLSGADNVVIEGNFIGTDATGAIDRGNTNAGVFILSDADDNTVGGTTPAARNVLSGNLVDVSIGNSTTAGNVVQGNYIGLNAAGTAAVPGVAGVRLNSAGATVIGGIGNAGNFIVGHTDSGIAVSNATSGVQILGNTIGLAADGVTPVPNTTGITFYDGFSGAPTNVTVGSSAAPNVIAGNSGDGINIINSNNLFATGIRIQYNSIHDNGGLAIDLGDNGVTPNDVLDGDSGFNLLQNFPQLGSAHALGGNLTVVGSLSSAPSTTYTVQVFHDAACDASGNGEAETYLGETSVTTGIDGNASFSTTIASAFTTGIVTAVAIDAAGNTSELSPCQAVVAVAQPSVTIADVSVLEGDAGTTAATFTVLLSAAPPAGATVDYTTANDTATTADNDYAAATNSVTFLAGETEKTFAITVNGDTNVEADETFFVNLTGATNATLADTQAVGTIKADDGLPSVAIADAAIAEGNAGATLLSFTVTVTPLPAFDVTVNYSTADGTALAGNDYTSASGTVTIPAGSPSATIDVTLSGDTMYELDETFVVNLFNASNATIGDGQATGTIDNDDPVPIVTVSDPSTTEGNVGTKSLVFTLTLSNPTYLNVSVPFSLADDSANVGSDYNITSGSVTFVSPTTSRTLGVGIIGDTDVEPDETFFLNLVSATNATLGDNQGIGTILNDDGLSPSLSVADVVVAEGDAGTSVATFTLMLSAPAAVAGSVNYSTANGTAASGSDYAGAAGTATFGIGQQAATVDVTINGDGVLEPDETFVLNLSLPVNVALSDNQALGTITNDDAAPDLAVTKSAPPSVLPGSSFSYTIEVANQGGEATGVVVTDALPAEVAFVSATPSQGSCSGTTTVTCNLGTMLAGGSATVTIAVTAPATPASFANTASALAEQIDAQPSDNGGNVTVTVGAAALDAVPTVSQWGLLALALALAAFAIARVAA